MNKHIILALLLLPCFLAHSQDTETFTAEGLSEPVEIIVDHWGIPHIYAQNQYDLFFAQGFYAAKDRLFQFEIWRRQATGTVAEILGERELQRDIGTRLFQYRGDMTRELNSYHDDGVEIISAFTDGVNAYIAQILQTPDQLPLPFQLLGIQPQPWTPEVVVSRHQGLLGNIGDELVTARAVSILGPEKVQSLSWFHPQKPDLNIDNRIDSATLFEYLIAPYTAFRRPVRFQPEDLLADVRNPDMEEYRNLALQEEVNYQRMLEEDINTIGSNNWIVSGEHTESGYPMMANDPHRTQAVPSLRYMAHLVAPGWNVIGGGEPEIPGISIGHNEFGTWGLTVYRTDAEDLYIYRTNPDNPDQYWYKGHWIDMLRIKDTIAVKGKDPVIVDHRYTIHGPVTWQNAEDTRAAAMRCGWLEPGGSPYLASLRMDQARNFDEFRKACNTSNIPGENMIWADREGNIGWQTVGIAPVRRNFSGMVPVWGDGTYEWDGYLPIMAKPHVYNPKAGFLATANENVTPNDYNYWDAIGYRWSDPYRGNRVREVLGSGRKHSLADMAALQTDYLSIPARQLLPFLLAQKGWTKKENQAISYLRNWDHRLSPESIAAGIYNAWESQIRSGIHAILIPEEGLPYLRLQMKQVIDALVLPDGRFGTDPIGGRDEFLRNCFRLALTDLSEKLNTDDMTKWQYGQADYKHISLYHPLSRAVKPALRKKLDLGPLPRGGNSMTVNNTSSNDNQTSGASFKIIVDTDDWDRSLATNSPGQSGNPDHPHYRNLFPIWAKDQYFPLFFSRAKIESVTSYKILLRTKP
ncbi:MAG: penicillin acylase family protein [Saprospiraceae bacterium]|nr:penicillin acylase family protein [Saprospiraceae bacterium]